MHKRSWSKQAVTTWILLALMALGLGQVLGLGLNRQPEGIIQEEEVSGPLILTGPVTTEAEIIYAPVAGFWTQIAPEGKVTVGQSLFSGPVSTEASSREVRLLSEGLKAEEMVLPRRRKNLHEAIWGLATGESEMTEAMALVRKAPSETELTQAQTRLSVLASQCETVTAPTGGIFVAQSDGKSLGYIVTSDRWQITLELPWPVAPGEEIAAELLSGIFQEAVLRVEAVEGTPAGCLARLSCEKSLIQAAKIRNLTVKILSE